MLKVSKIQPPGKDGETTVPTVGDFVQLLKKHQFSCHKFLHQCAKNGKELTGWYLDWAKKAASQFRRDTTLSDPTAQDAGDLTKPLNELFSKLPSEQQEQILPILDAQSKYLDELHASSKIRLGSVLKSAPSKNPAIAKILSSTSNSSRSSSRASSPGPKPATTPTLSSFPDPSTDPGPGAYLARWQDLLDNTPITPLEPTSKVKTAGSKRVMKGSTEDVDGQQMVYSEDGIPIAGRVVAGGGKVGSKKPDVEIVIDAMASDFRELLATRSVYW
jgi:hypothetical protein